MGGWLCPSQGGRRQWRGLCRHPRHAWLGSAAPTPGCCGGGRATAVARGGGATPPSPPPSPPLGWVAPPLPQGRDVPSHTSGYLWLPLVPGAAEPSSSARGQGRGGRPEGQGPAPPPPSLSSQSREGGGRAGLARLPNN